MSFINCHSTFCSSKTPLLVTNIPNEQWLGNNMLQCDKYITVYKTGRKEWANAGPDMITRRRLVPWKVNVKVYDHQSKYEFVVSYLLFMCFPVRPHPIRWTMVMSPTINYGWLLPSTHSLSPSAATLHTRAGIRTLGWTNWRPSRICETISICKTLQTSQPSIEVKYESTGW